MCVVLAGAVCCSRPEARVLPVVVAFAHGHRANLVSESCFHRGQGRRFFDLSLPDIEGGVREEKMVRAMFSLARKLHPTVRER